MVLISRVLSNIVIKAQPFRQCFASAVIKQDFNFARFSTSVIRSAKLFTDKHEWVVVDGKIGTVGISQYAQDSLGDIVYAQLPDVGTEYALMDECGALESVKAASELYCPLSGKVTEKNTEVETTPGLINQSCYDKGWLFKMELTKPEELKEMMDEPAYEKFLKAQHDDAESDSK